MTGNDIGEGTRAHRAGNRRFGLGMLILIALAGAIGVSLHLMRHGSGPGSIPPLGAIAVAIGFTLVIAVGGWWGFRAVDEVEQRYSMIAATVGWHRPRRVHILPRVHRYGRIHLGRVDRGNRRSGANPVQCRLVAHVRARARQLTP